MSLRIVVIYCLIFFIADAYAGVAPGQPSEQLCHAVVQDKKAVFVFPIIEDEHWTWFNKETKDNQLEYSWEVLLHEKQHSYNLGGYLFKYSGQNEKSGSLKQLLSDAEWSVFEIQATPSGGTTSIILDDLRITPGLTDGGVVVNIKDKDTFNRIFANSPKSAHFIIRVPLEVPFTCDAVIEYHGQE